jgi:hypothetical protein
MASGLIAHCICYIIRNLGTSYVCPLVFSWENFAGMFGEDRKSRSSDCFSVMASLSVHRFDCALAYDVFSILLVFFLIKYIYIYIYIWGEFAGFFFLWLIRYCMHSCLISQFGLHWFNMLRYNWEFWLYWPSVFPVYAKVR